MESMPFELGVVEGKLDLKWAELTGGILDTCPSIGIAGYDIYFLQVPRRESYRAFDPSKKGIISVVSGALEYPRLQERGVGFYRGVEIKNSDKETLLLVARIVDEQKYDFSNPPEIKKSPDTNRAPLRWKPAGEVWPALKGRNMHFTYPILKLEDPNQKRFYRVKLWHAGPNVQMGIHRHSNEPGMQEIHVQLAGSGVMQKFRDENYNSLYEEVPQFPGQTHEPFWDKDGNYPFHQYEAGPDGTLFAAIESVARPPV